MVTIEFLGPINKRNLSADVKSLGELSQLLKQDSTINQWLENCAVAVNDIIINDKNFKLNNGDKVSLLPPVCGG